MAVEKIVDRLLVLAAKLEDQAAVVIGARIGGFQRNGAVESDVASLMRPAWR